MKRRNGWLSAAGAGATVLVAGVVAVVATVGAPKSDTSAESALARASGKERSNGALARLPLSFEVNEGQAGKDVSFLSRGKGYNLFLTPREAVLALRKGNANPDAPTRADNARDAAAQPDRSAVIRMEFLGGASNPTVAGLDKLPGKSNYFMGNDPSQWRTNIAHYSKVQYADVYPGIDVLYYGTDGNLEYDFVVEPGADPGQIRMAVHGADQLSIRDGDLVMRVDGLELRQEQPVVYQEDAGVRRPVSAEYRLAQGGRVSFELGDYDPARPLVIDPVFTFSTYLGGTGADAATGVDVDADGYIYVTGQTVSTTTFPRVAAYDSVYNGGNSDGFVSKISPDGTSLIFSTFIGGNGVDVFQDVALDSTGAIFLTGYSASTNYPLSSAVQGTRLSLYDGIVTKLQNDGSALFWSTYHGGNNDDFPWAVEVDSSGNPYVAGQTRSTNFPVTVGAYKTVYGADIEGFITKFNGSTGARSGVGAYSTYITGGGLLAAGNRTDKVFDVNLDSSNQAYLTGTTDSTNFPTLAPYQAASAGSFDAFLLVLNSAGSGLVTSTYLGGNAVDEGRGIVLDTSGNVYICGATNSTLNFPTNNGFQTANASGSDGFLTKYDTSGSIVYSSYIGGGGTDVATALDVDVNQRVYLTGSTTSTDDPASPAVDEGFPVTANAYQSSLAGGVKDTFLVWMEPALSGTASRTYGTYLGGSGGDEGCDVKTDLDGCGSAIVVGFTFSNNFPVEFPIQASKGSTSSVDSDAFLFKIDENSIPRANAGSNVIIQCDDSAGTDVELDASASTGEEDDPSPPTYEWYEGVTLLGTGETLTHSFALGLHTVTLRITDWCNRISTDTLTVNVVDSESPVFDDDESGTGMLPDVTLNPDNPPLCDQSDQDPTAPGFSDCDPATSLVGVRDDSLPLTDPYPYGTTVITWTATDGQGNPPTVALQEIIVVDITPPTLTIPGDVVTPADDETGAVLDLVELGIEDGGGSPLYSATDTCDPDVMIVAFRDNPGLADTGDPSDLAGLYPLGESVITWIAIDHEINFTVELQTVYVEGSTSVSSEFTADAEDWTVYGPDVTGATHSLVDGNPDGYIYGTQSTASSELWYFDAPSAYLGNKEAALGQPLSFDIKVDGAPDVSSDLGVIITGGGLQIYAPLGSAPTTSWVTKAVLLNTFGGWKVDDGDGDLSDDVLATDDDIQTVLGSIASLRIGGKFRGAAGAQTSLDNPVLNLNYTATP